MTRPEPTPPESGVLARLFGDLGRVDLAKLSAHLKPVALEPREAVFEQGSPGWIQWLIAAAPLGFLVCVGAGPGRVRRGGGAGERRRAGSARAGPEQARRFPVGYTAVTVAAFVL